MNDLEFPFAEMSFKRTTPPTVVLNDTCKPNQIKSTVDPPNPSLSQQQSAMLLLEKLQLCVKSSHLLQR